MHTVLGAKYSTEKTPVIQNLPIDLDKIFLVIFRFIPLMSTAASATLFKLHYCFYSLELKCISPFIIHLFIIFIGGLHSSSSREGECSLTQELIS